MPWPSPTSASAAWLSSVSARGVRWRSSPALALGGIAITAALVWFPFGVMADVYFKRVAQPYAADGSEIVATREGPSETIFLMQQKWMGEPVYSRLVTNGFSMSGTSVAAMRYMRYFVYWPMVVHRGPLKRVLVVCYGVGVTVEAALDLPSVESIDVAEISADVIAMSDAMYPVRAAPALAARSPARRGRPTVPRDDVRSLRPHHRRATAAADARRRQHLHARVLSADSRPSRRWRHHDLLVARRPARSRHQRQRDHQCVLRGVR